MGPVNMTMKVSKSHPPLHVLLLVMMKMDKVIWMSRSRQVSIITRKMSLFKVTELEKQWQYIP